MYFIKSCDEIFITQYLYLKITGLTGTYINNDQTNAIKFVKMTSNSKYRTIREHRKLRKTKSTGRN